MNAYVAAHEGFMNGSRIILPRVGGGVGGGVGVGVREACISSYWRELRPVDNPDASPLHAVSMQWALTRQIRRWF